MEFRWILVVLTVSSSYYLAECALDLQCLKCICETVTKCVSRPCDSVKCAKIEMKNYDCSCGPFGITPPFWIAANRPILNGTRGNDAEKFKKCVETFPCSILAVQYYSEKYAEDCDGDKRINCDDYVVIHALGPTNCRRNASLSEEQLKRYSTCMGRTGVTHPSGSGKTTPTTTVATTSGKDNKTETSSSTPPIPTVRKNSTTYTNTTTPIPTVTTNETKQGFELVDKYGSAFQDKTDHEFIRK